jgi:Lipoprotein confined to pathogenic Mycobacterium
MFFAVSLAGCANESPGTAGSSQGGKPSVAEKDPVAILKARPDIEQMMATYDRLLKDIRTQLTDAGIAGEWSTFQEAGSADCLDFGDSFELNAETRSTPSWGLDKGIAESDWPATLAIIKNTSAPVGFTTIETVKNEPGHHVLAIQGPYGAVMWFLTNVKASISIDSGCHRIPGKPLDPANPQNSLCASVYRTVHRDQGSWLPLPSSR